MTHRSDIRSFVRGRTWNRKAPTLADCQFWLHKWLIRSNSSVNHSALVFPQFCIAHGYITTLSSGVFQSWIDSLTLSENSSSFGRIGYAIARNICCSPYPAHYARSGKAEDRSGYAFLELGENWSDRSRHKVSERFSLL